MFLITILLLGSILVCLIKIIITLEKQHKENAERINRFGKSALDRIDYLLAIQTSITPAFPLSDLTLARSRERDFQSKLSLLWPSRKNTDTIPQLIKQGTSKQDLIAEARQYYRFLLDRELARDEYKFKVKLNHEVSLGRVSLTEAEKMYAEMYTNSSNQKKKALEADMDGLLKEIERLLK
jgi:hypothetical protein